MDFNKIVQENYLRWQKEYKIEETIQNHNFAEKDLILSLDKFGNPDYLGMYLKGNNINYIRNDYGSKIKIMIDPNNKINYS
jgi:hypothetical protein